MSNRKTTLLLAAVLAAVLLGAAVFYRSLSNRAAPAADAGGSQAAESAAAPDFTMLGANGDSVRFSDYAGTPVVLNFWASWCGPCKREMPTFDAVAAELDGKVAFLMVNLTDGSRETQESAAQFIQEQGYAFPVFYDTLSEGAAAYAVRSIPVTYFIDSAGSVLAYSAGSMEEETLRQGIDLIFQE